MKDCECYRVEHEIRYSEGGIGKTISVERCAGTKEMDVCGCHGNKLCCDFYPEKRREGIRETFSSKADKELLFWLRTHMTSITRYVFNEHEERDGKYKELAKQAVNAILFMINGECKDPNYVQRHECGGGIGRRASSHGMVDGSTPS